MKDDLRYTPSDCFETFPFPWGNLADLEALGRAYHEHRASFMIAAEEGLTKTYNRFHDPAQNGAELIRLRNLHDQMDAAVLRAYGWDDLAERAVPEFLLKEDPAEYPYSGRLFWAAEMRDEVLKRLIDLNRQRAAEEVNALPLLGARRA